MRAPAREREDPPGRAPPRRAAGARPGGAGAARAPPRRSPGRRASGAGGRTGRRTRPSGAGGGRGRRARGPRGPRRRTTRRPPSGRSRPPISERSVVFPEPEWPTTAVRPPRPTSKECVDQDRDAQAPLPVRGAQSLREDVRVDHALFLRPGGGVAAAPKRRLWEDPQPVVPPRGRRGGRRRRAGRIVPPSDARSGPAEPAALSTSWKRSQRPTFWRKGEMCGMKGGKFYALEQPPAPEAEGSTGGRAGQGAVAGIREGPGPARSRSSAAAALSRVTAEGFSAEVRGSGEPTPSSASVVVFGSLSFSTGAWMEGSHGRSCLYSRDEFATVIGSDAQFKGGADVPGRCPDRRPVRGRDHDSGQGPRLEGRPREGRAARGQRSSWRARSRGNMTAEDRVDLRASGVLHGDLKAAKLSACRRAPRSSGAARSAPPSRPPRSRRRPPRPSPSDPVRRSPGARH